MDLIFGILKKLLLHFLLFGLLLKRKGIQETTIMAQKRKGMWRGNQRKCTVLWAFSVKNSYKRAREDVYMRAKNIICG